MSRPISSPVTSRPPAARQCCGLFRDRGLGRRTLARSATPSSTAKCLQSCEACTGPFRAPARCCSTRWPADGAAARFHRGSKTATRPLFATLFARAFKAACAPTTSASECFHEHDHGPLETPQTTGKWLGRPSPAVKVAFRPGQPPKLHKDRGREHRTSALPIGIAPAGDFAPTSFASSTSCREKPLFSLSGATRERGGTASAAHACKRAQRQGRAACRLREEEGRSPTRGAFCPNRLLASEQVYRSTDSRSWTATTQRLFHHRET